MQRITDITRRKTQEWLILSMYVAGSRLQPWTSTITFAHQYLIHILISTHSLLLQISAFQLCHQRRLFAILLLSFNQTKLIVIDTYYHTRNLIHIFSVFILLKAVSYSFFWFFPIFCSYYFVCVNCLHITSHIVIVSHLHVDHVWCTFAVQCWCRLSDTNCSYQLSYIGSVKLRFEFCYFIDFEWFSLAHSLVIRLRLLFTRVHYHLSWVLEWVLTQYTSFLLFSYLPRTANTNPK